MSTGSRLHGTLGTLGTLAGLALLATVLAGCGGPVLANPPVTRPVAVPAAPATPRRADPRPVILPADDAPHDRLTEWWYYTGHLRDETGGRWGFEFVVFRAERGSFPVTWASHLALTDEAGGRFHYAERAEVGPQVNVAAPGAPGFSLGIRGLDPSDPATFIRTPWAMTGSDGDRTTRLGMLRVIPMSSIDWWVAPSLPLLRPA